jgi:hypothetical protein
MMANPWGICDRCSFKVRHSSLKKEWSGFMVCADCFDPRPADTRPPRIKPEGLPIRDARPEPEPVFREEGELGGDDL